MAAQLISLYGKLTTHRLKCIKFVSVGLPASTNDYISRNVRKSSIFGVMPHGSTVNFTLWEINHT